MCNAFWLESRRWAGGMLPTGTCLHCFDDIGDTEHVVVGCEAIEQDVWWQRLAGRDVCEASVDIEIMPLILRALPPSLGAPAPFPMRFLKMELGATSLGCSTAMPQGLAPRRRHRA